MCSGGTRFPACVRNSAHTKKSRHLIVETPAFKNKTTSDSLSILYDPFYNHFVMISCCNYHSDKVYPGRKVMCSKAVFILS